MTIEIFLLIAIFVFSLGSVGLAFYLQSKSRQSANLQLQEMAKQILEAQKNDQSVQFLQREVNGLRDQLTKNMSESAKLIMESQKSVGDRLDRAAQVVGTVQKSLGALDEATKRVFMVGKDISQLQEILRAPKMRGSFGELFLGDLLAQILPPKHFSLQYKFRSGQVVDAIVHLGKKVPVDAKFPLENFKRVAEAQDFDQKTAARRKFINDVKKHIDAISDKYILPDEDTFEFALMYIPAENVYYETIIKENNEDEEKSLLSYAFSKHVVPVSPNSFYAYLHTISLGLRGLKIEENARQIFDQLSRLRGDFSRFREDFVLVGKHLNNTRTKYEDAEKRLNRFDDKLTSASRQDETESVEARSEPSLPVS